MWPLLQHPHYSQRDPPVSEALGCSRTPSAHFSTGTSDRSICWAGAAKSLPTRLGTKLSSSHHPSFTGWLGLPLRWHFLSMSCLLRVAQPCSWLWASVLHLLHRPPLLTVLIITPAPPCQHQVPTHSRSVAASLTSHSSPAVLVALSNVFIHKHACSVPAISAPALEHPNTVQSKTPTHTGSSFPFWA